MEERSFEALGMGAVEERLYRLLVTRPDSTPSELSRLSGVTQPRARRALDSLLDRGLASRSASRSPRFSPVRPDHAIEVLILRQQEGLEQARLAATQLVDRFLSSAGKSSPIELVEVVSGRDAVVQQFQQLQHSAKSEILLFDKPPYALDVNETEIEMLEAGIAYRVAYDRDALEAPGQLEIIRRMVEAGEQARVISGVPMKMAVADRHLGLVPLSISDPGVERGVLIHASPLLDALRMLFEMLWEGAVPVGSPRAPGEAGKGKPGLSEEDGRVLMLLAAGLKDGAIASQLGVGRRTVQRRVRHLEDLLGARTRPQVLLQAARRGWL